MAGETTTDPLISTKLHRPPVDRDHVHRPRLLEELDLHRLRPLTLVSAPAGYGKSVLISCWLEQCDIPSTWISLDENKLEAVFKNVPEHTDLPPDINEQLVVELYSK